MKDLADIAEIDPKARIKHFRKGDQIQRAGDAKAYKYYVKTGLLRSYIIDSKGKEHIFMFAPGRMDHRRFGSHGVQRAR